VQGPTATSCRFATDAAARNSSRARSSRGTLPFSSSTKRLPPSTLRFTLIAARSSKLCCQNNTWGWRGGCILRNHLMEEVPEVKVSKSPEEASAEVPQNLPGAVPEVHVPVPALSLAANPEPSPHTQTAIPLYSPRSTFIAPDVDAAKLHASENRPMRKDPLSAHVSPYVSTFCIPISAHD
jgi:hypothetical protein